MHRKLIYSSLNFYIFCGIAPNFLKNTFFIYRDLNSDVRIQLIAAKQDAMRIHDTFRSFVERGRLGDNQLIRSYLLFSEEAVLQIVVRDLIKFESSVVVDSIQI